MMSFTLFVTEACHLCDDAKAVIVQAANVCAFEVYLEDIAESEKLVTRYGERIPVLRHDESSAELSWPFDSEGVVEWLNQISDKRNP